MDTEDYRVGISLKVPHTLYENLKVLARENDRSVSAELRYLANKHLAEQSSRTQTGMELVWQKKPSHGA